MIDKSIEAASGAVRKEIAIAIRDNGIPPRPTALIEIDKEMAKDEPDFSHLARIITADVSLAAAMLKTANSPFFGLDKKVRSVPEALLMLGLKLTIQTIASIELRKAFKDVPQLDRFWDESGTTARVAGWLAIQLRPRCWIRSEDAYTFALFHDCGIPILLRPFPEYRNVLGKANTSRDKRFTDIEDDALGTNHAEMGANLAASWLLPSEIIEGIRNHHKLDSLADKDVADPLLTALPLIAITHFAEHLIYMRTGMDKTFEWAKTAEAAMRILNITEAQIPDLFDRCHEPMAGYFG